MKIPGFTAEHSVYKASKHVTMPAAEQRAAGKESVIIPQQIHHGLYPNEMTTCGIWIVFGHVYRICFLGGVMRMGN